MGIVTYEREYCPLLSKRRYMVHARVTIAHYQPGTQEEATSILREVMLPKARELQGFN